MTNNIRLAGFIPHRWDLDAKQAVRLQQQLAYYIDTKTSLDLKNINLVGGVDVNVKDGVSKAAVVLLSFPALTLVEYAVASVPTPFPYIPGLLSFREGSVIIRAYEQLNVKADAYLFDGMGIMHPRRMGIASHIGLWFDAPTLGCGKTYLLGDYTEPDSEKGAFSPVTHHGEIIGYSLRTRTNVKPVFISPGHLMTLDNARELSLACTGKYRLPEPVRAAHKYAGQHA